MDDTPGTGTTATPTKKKRGRGMLWGLLAVVIAFTAGFLWQFYEATTVRDQLTVAEQELAMERLRVHLGQAALAAQSGNYEMARQQMSGFFGRLEDLPVGVDPAVAGVAENFLDMRDEVITGLSRSNPEYADVVSGMYENLDGAIDRSLGTTTGVPATPIGAPSGEPTQEGESGMSPVDTGPGGG
jgi:hypothetical protein